MKPTISSLKFAHDFGIRHFDVLNKIRSFKCSDEFNQINFSLVEYVDQKGQKRPMYKITQQGF
ncbi:MAG: Rha family transcriptional regulator, partial [Flavobacterium sp.]